MRQNKTTVKAMLGLKKKFLIPCVYHFYKNPPLIERGKGVYVYDKAGKRYIDGYSGVGVVNCGHVNTKINGQIIKQLNKLQHTTTIYLTEPMLKLAKKLSQFIGGGLKRSFFCTSGSEANEGAMLLAKLHTNRSEFIALSESLHGRTYLTAGATGMRFWRTDPNPPKNIHFAKSPICHQCPLGLKYPTCNIKCANEVGKIIQRRPGKIAAMIAESIHGNGGIQVPPKEYFEKVNKILKSNNVLLIMDEAQTGFGRTGKKFGYNHFGITPDILMVCKALGNGMPISAFVTTDKIAASYTKPGASTFGGNLACSEGAIATLDYIQSEKLVLNARRQGAYFKKELIRQKKNFPFISDLRGLGLMIGIELKRVDGTPASEETDMILEHLKDIGVMAGKTGAGRNVLTFMPPLVIRRSQIQAILSKLKIVFKKNQNLFGF